MADEQVADIRGKPTPKTYPEKTVWAAGAAGGVIGALISGLIVGASVSSLVSRTVVTSMVSSPPLTITQSAPASAAETSATPAAQPPAAKIDGFPGDGTFRVGADIQPGTYYSQSADGKLPCSWTRLGILGDPDSIIAAGGDTAGTLYAKIEPGDAAFVTRWCAPWRQAAG